MATKFNGQRNSSKIIGSLTKLMQPHPYPIRPLPVAQREDDGPLKGRLEFAPFYYVDEDL